jgi:hypothetical protein
MHPALNERKCKDYFVPSAKLLRQFVRGTSSSGVTGRANSELLKRHHGDETIGDDRLEQKRRHPISSSRLRRQDWSGPNCTSKARTDWTAFMSVSSPSRPERPSRSVLERLYGPMVSAAPQISHRSSLPRPSLTIRGRTLHRSSNR